MPKFTQEKIEIKAAKPKGIPNEVIEKYMEYVKSLEKGNEGRLEFEEGENITQARKALVEAGLHLKQYVKVKKPRGETNVLTFVQISKKEFDEARAKAMARGAKLKGKRKKA
jgi:hypothetical protein